MIFVRVGRHHNLGYQVCTYAADGVQCKKLNRVDGLTDCGFFDRDKDGLRQAHEKAREYAKANGYHYVEGFGSLHGQPIPVADRTTQQYHLRSKFAL